MFTLLIFLLLLLLQTPSSFEQNCNETQTFVKIRSLTLARNESVLLYNDPGNAVTSECHRRCLMSTNCSGFLVNYPDASCFRALSKDSVIVGESTPGITTNYFEKVCLNVPSTCVNKFWALERVDGYELVGFSTIVIPQVQSGLLCSQLCLSEKNFTCRSATFFVDKKECSLSTEDRRTQKSSFRATIWKTQYWENQCAPDAFADTSCSLEEYPNGTICCADDKAENVTQLQCQERCHNETFNCRGFTFIPSRGSTEASYCLLHGDDSSSIGPRGIQSLVGATYWEKVPCLPLDVACTIEGISVLLHSQNFVGRMYVIGHSEKCYTQGREGKEVKLDIPLQREGRDVNRCGVMVAHSVGESNRTLLSTFVMIQYNPIIQRRGDRAVKIGCLLDRSSTKNMTLGVSLSFAADNSQEGTTAVNSSTIPPTVSLRIVDPENESNELKEVVLGQSLQLRVDVVPENSSYGIHVFNLIATSQDGADSYLLLDNRGCPTNPNDFSALRRIPTRSRSLAADFTAFKFPNSNVVRFRATVHFCPGFCSSVDCIVSHGRKRRDTLPSFSEFEELPVQLAIIVRTPGPESNALYSSEENICMSWGTLLGIILAWILLQFIILGIWFFVLHYRRGRKQQDETKLQDDFSEYDNRHVHWADT